MDAISAAGAGMRDALGRSDRAAEKTVRAFTPDSREDPVAAIVEQMQAKLQFRASAATFRAGDDMMGALLDLRI
jgi:hypothetical protein